MNKPIQKLTRWIHARAYRNSLWTGDAEGAARTALDVVAANQRAVMLRRVQDQKLVRMSPRELRAHYARMVVTR